MVKAAISKLGAPYVSGAKGPNKFDCSGLVYWAVKEVDPELGYIMYINAAGQAKWCYNNVKAGVEANSSRAIWYSGRILAAKAAAAGMKSIIRVSISEMARS